MIKIKEKMRIFVHKYLLWVVVYYSIALLITFGWQGLEFLFYGEIQHRIVDDIIGGILILSIFINLVFIRAIYVPKADRDKYIVFDKEEYKSIQRKKYEKYYSALKTLKNNLQISDVIISDTIKNENGEETSTIKFDSIKTFAQNMKCFNDLNIQYIEKQLCENEE
ncbi:hypothetical protein IMSAGC013_01480 [Lachnospiraceae bacterium]|jgi:hypothetical protein|nr:hypothetical protein IMSAGC013_01480 [Lachnospiraceae bacterium]